MSSYTKRVRNLAVSVYDLIPHQSEQLEMFSSRSHAVAEAMDKINDKYGLCGGVRKDPARTASAVGAGVIRQRVFCWFLLVISGSNLSLNDDRKNLGLGNKNQKKPYQGRNRTEFGNKNLRSEGWRNNLCWFLLVYFGFFWPVCRSPKCSAIGIIRLDGRSSIRHYQAQKEKRPASPLAW
jgi:hypothetical protein